MSWLEASRARLRLLFCRRAAEYEVRRLRRRLARHERELARRIQLDRWNNGLLSTLRGLDGRTWLDDTNAIRFEIDALRARLHVLRHPWLLSREVRRDGAATNHRTEE